MKQLGRIAALAGFAVAVFLVWREHPQTTWRLMREAGLGLVLAAVVHILPMWANAWDWRTLIRPAERLSLLTMLKIVWIRESVNGLLPVARVGGEIVSFRLLGRLGVRPATALGSLVVDIQLTLISQLLFAFLACAYVLDGSSSSAARTVSTLLWSISAAVPVLVLFALVQHARPFERFARVLNQVTSGKLVELVGKSVRIDQAVKLIWRRKGTVLRYLFIWQTIQFIGFSLEIWLALRVLGAQPTFVQACVIEALIQIVSSIAFLVPASLVRITQDRFNICLACMTRTTLHSSASKHCASAFLMQPSPSSRMGGYMARTERSRISSICSNTRATTFCALRIAM